MDADFSQVGLNSAAHTIELRAFFDNEGRSRNLSLDVCGAAEHELFAGENVAFDRAVDLRDRHFDYRFRQFRSRADDQRAVL